MSSSSRSISLPDARGYAAELLERLRPACVNGMAMVAGSIRRQVNWVGDLDLVCVPDCVERTPEAVGQGSLFAAPPAPVLRSKVWEVCNELVEEGLLSPMSSLSTAAEPLLDTRWSAKSGWGDARAKRLRFLHAVADVGVDIWLPDPYALPVILAIRTGSGEFVKELVTKCRVGSRGRRVISDGRLVANGTPVVLQDERELFEACGVAWVEPALRSSSAACRWNQRRRAA